MEQSKQENTNDHNAAQEQSPIKIEISKMDNAVLKRLIGEIDFENENRIHSYNRTHNRHNRGR